MNSKTLYSEIVKVLVTPNAMTPSTEGVRMIQSNGQVKLIGSNLETHIENVFSTSDDVDLDIIIPKLIIDTLKLLNEDVRFEETDTQIILHSNKNKYEASKHDVSDFPKPQESKPIAVFDLPASKIDRLSTVSRFASSDELRLAMTGVYFNCENGVLDIVATDAQKLIVETVKFDQFPQVDNFKCIPTAKDLAKLKGRFFQSAVVKVCERNIKFSEGGLTIQFKLIDAKYPDYNAVIPRDYNKTIKLDKSKLSESAKRVSNFGHEANIKLSIQGESVEVLGVNQDYNLGAKETIACISDEDMEVKVGHSNLSSMLGAIDSSEIELNYEANNKPVITSHENTTVLIMPVVI